MAEYNVDEYNVEGEDTQYNFKISLVDNKINLQLTENVTERHGKNYEGEFTLEELRQINRVFQLTPTIYDAQEEFKKAVERQKIALSENEAYVNIMFQMVLGTDNSPFVIALPRNESARITKLEQNSDMLKLERDNLFDKLEIIKRNVNEIFENTSELEEDNNKLKNTTNKFEEEMSLSSPVNPINPSEIVNNPPSYNNMNNMNTNMTPNMNTSQNANYRSKNKNLQKNMTQSVNNQNNNLIKSSNQANPNQNIYKSTTYNRPIKPNQSQNQNVNQNPKNMQLLNERLKSPPQQQKLKIKRFPCGILANIIKNEKEIANVTQRIQGYLNKKIYYSLLYYARAEGDKASTFHKKCDKAKKSLVLIMDGNGNRFGGFTMRDWAGNCIQKKDERAFIFSVDKNKIYGVLPDQVAIGCYPGFGPIFFGCQIRVYDNFFTKGGSTYLKGLNYATEEDYELTNGEQSYQIRELEVYDVKEVKA